MGLTSPDPLWHPYGLTMFDPSPPGPQTDDDILPKAAHSLGNLLSAAAGTCCGLCQVGTSLARLWVPHTLTQVCMSRV